MIDLARAKPSGTLLDYWDKEFVRSSAFFHDFFHDDTPILSEHLNKWDHLTLDLLLVMAVSNFVTSLTHYFPTT